MKPATTGRLPRLLHAIPRRLASVKLGSVLVIAVFASMLAAAFFPGTEAAGFFRSIGQALELDGLTQVRELTFQERFETPPFILLVALLSVSLCFSLYFRIKGELKRRRAEAAALPREAGPQVRRGLAGAAVAAVEQALRRRGYRTHAVCAAGTWKVHGTKGGAGVWGSVLFHIGILLILAAVVLSTSASFKASAKLTEGQSFDARVDAYGTQQAGRWYSPAAQPLTFRLVRVEPEHEVDGAPTVASIVEPTLEGRKTRFTEPTPVYINNGLRHAGLTLHQGRDTGYAPLVVVENAAGERLLTGYTRLATMAGAEKLNYLDLVEIKDKGIRIELELLPDAVYRDGAYLSRSGALKNPVLHVVVRERGKAAFDQFIPVTRDASAGGYTVFFGDVRRWSQIDVSDAPGVPVLMAGALLGALGLALRLLWVRRRVVVSLPEVPPGQEVIFDVTGSSEKFQRLFEEELATLRAAIAQRLTALSAPEGERNPWAPSARPR
ncbi:MAG TPA: cytochrome c biogenesis protein ResB [Xanthomonadales bacterium]|nr:cytochrome c biogenesis protein ResB [Xanthomonadales bacterium]